MTSKNTYRDRNERFRTMLNDLMTDIKETYTELAKLENYSFIDDALEREGIVPPSDSLRDKLNAYTKVDVNWLSDFSSVDYYCEGIVTAFILEIVDQDMMCLTEGGDEVTVSLEESTNIGDIVNVIDEMKDTSKVLKLNEFVEKID